MSENSAIVATDLSIRRGNKQVFDRLNLTIPVGKITGVIGPSGGGKTTLLRAIVGVQKVQSGAITVLGEPAGSPSLRSRVAYDTQGASVYDDLTVSQNLRYFAAIHGATDDDVGRVLSAVELHGQRRRVVAELSGGQHGRVSLAAAMVGKPDVLVLDEPTVGLDPLLRLQLWDIFRALAEKGVTLVVSSHVLDEALRCDEVVLIHEGRILAHTTPQDFLDRTGATDPDTAFLRLIEGDAGANRAPGGEGELR